MFSLFFLSFFLFIIINDLSLRDMLADDTTLHTSGEKNLQIRSYIIQDSLDQVSNWCDNNHMVTNLIKTKSMTIATRQKHQLSPLPLDLILRGAKSVQVSEHRLVGIIIDNKPRWDSHADNGCKTVSTWVFLPFSKETVL